MTGGPDHGARRRPAGKPTSRRSLRAVLSSDLAGFSGQVSVDETKTLVTFKELREIALALLEDHNGWLFGMPGDGFFALFESAIDAVECALALQRELAERRQLYGMRMRVGIHMGEVLFDNELPFGEALAIAARLESLAEPGTILISAPVFDAVSARIAASFEQRGTPALKNIPRRITTYCVTPLPEPAATADTTETSTLDRTMYLDRRQLRQIRDGVYVPGEPDAAVADRAPVAQQPSPPPSPSEPPASEAHTTSTGMAGDDSDAHCERHAGDVHPAALPQAVGADHAGCPGPLQEQFAEMLAFYVGPMARVIVERCARRAETAEQLVAFLEDEIPDPDERMAFRLRATQVYLNQDQS